MSRFKHQVVIVTGASKGMGADIALGFAREGASVVINYANDTAAADQIVHRALELGGTAISVQADVSKPAEVDKLFDQCIAHFGRVDVVVNNAGLYRFAPLEEITTASVHAMFELNVLGVILCCQRAAREFPLGHGCIINIGSTATAQTPAGSLVYTATKGAVDMITGTLAKELGPRGIRVNSINPGLVSTEGTHSLGIIGGDVENDFVQRTPLGRVGTPEDITPLALFLASDDARWLTGEIMIASGGIR